MPSEKTYPCQPPRPPRAEGTVGGTGRANLPPAREGECARRWIGARAPTRDAPTGLRRQPLLRG